MREHFRQLALTWLHESGRFDHPAYLEILALGPDVLPHILEWMQDGQEGAWDHALSKLTTIEMQGATPEEVAQNWLKWGSDAGLILLQR